jgi:hypothetical protein
LSLTPPSFVMHALKAEAFPLNTVSIVVVRLKLEPLSMMIQMDIKENKSNSLERRVFYFSPNALLERQWSGMGHLPKVVSENKPYNVFWTIAIDRTDNSRVSRDLKTVCLAPYATETGHKRIEQWICSYVQSKTEKRTGYLFSSEISVAWVNVEPDENQYRVSITEIFDTPATLGEYASFDTEFLDAVTCLGGIPVTLLHDDGEESVDMARISMVSSDDEDEEEGGPPAAQSNDGGEESTDSDHGSIVSFGDEEGEEEEEEGENEVRAGREESNLETKQGEEEEEEEKGSD